MYICFQVAHGAPRHASAARQDNGRRTWRSDHKCLRLWTALLLAATSLLLVIGCGEDTDVARVDLTDVRISETSSVFDILASKVFEFTQHDGGFLFGIQNGEIELGEVTMKAQDVPQTAFVVRDFDQLDEELNFEEGEGNMDGDTACRFTVSRSTVPNMAVGNVTTCEVCDIVIHAREIPLGGSGRGELSWHLARCRDAGDTSFESVAVEVTITVDDAGNLTAVDAISVAEKLVP